MQNLAFLTLFQPRACAAWLANDTLCHTLTVKITPEQVAKDQPPRLAKCLVWMALALFIVAAILFGLAYGKASSARHTERQALLALTPRQDKTKGYTSSASCRACHPSQYDSWHKSFHRTMTQLAGTNSVMGRFDGTEIVSGGLLYRVYQTNGQYWAEMPDPEIMMKAVMGGIRINDHTYRIKRTADSPLEELDLRTIPQVKKRVVMTTGSHHYQTYWVEGSVRNRETNQDETKYGNLLQTLPLVYLPKERPASADVLKSATTGGQWIPRENAFMTAPNSKRMISQWNHHCIKCHSTAGNPGLKEDDLSFDTKVIARRLPATRNTSRTPRPQRSSTPLNSPSLITNAPAKSAANATAFTYTMTQK